ncbi:MAG: 30S ribosomal protein S17 [bacterium JZ-2024 1]
MRKRRKGVVVSSKMQKTVVVEVERMKIHPLYKKAVRQTRRYMADTGGGIYKEGDIVEIEETRPLSKRKRWRVVQKLGETTPGVAEVGGNDTTANPAESGG